MLRRSMHVRASYDDECVCASEPLARYVCARIFRDGLGKGSLENKCEVPVNDGKLKNVFCTLTRPINVTNVLPRLDPTP